MSCIRLGLNSERFNYKNATFQLLDEHMKTRTIGRNEHVVQSMLLNGNSAGHCGSQRSMCHTKAEDIQSSPF